MGVLEIVLFLLAGVWQGIWQDFNLLEIGVVGALLVWGAPRVRIPTIRLNCVGWGLAAVGVRLALLPVLPWPVPVVSDEFSHLLLADTLLHGRLANPTHPFWVHFETLHVIQQPHYVSNYFPGNAAVLAAAIWLTGQAWVGVVLLSGIFSAVLCWALGEWMPRRWAAFGTLLALLRFSIGSYWVNALHGGFLAAIGGALVIGAYPKRRGWVLGLGLAILAVSRPMEGALFALPIVLMLPWWRLRVLAPVGLCLGLTFAGLGYYCYSITGSPVKTAYGISQKTYGWPASLMWVKPKPIAFRHVELERYYQYEVDEHDKVNSPAHFLQYLTFRTQEYWRFFLGVALSVPLAMIPWVWRKRRLRVVFFGLAAAFGAVMLEGAASPHYIAPATAAILLLLVECFRRLSVTDRGRNLARALPCVLVLVLAVRIAAQNLGLPYTQEVNYQSWCCKLDGNLDKHRITTWLLQQPGSHLVFVKAKTDEHNLLQWIYNSADIDGSRIVWARDLGAAQNRKLMEHYAHRKVWVVDPNANWRGVPSIQDGGSMPNNLSAVGAMSSMPGSVASNLRLEKSTPGTSTGSTQ